MIVSEFTTSVYLVGASGNVIWVKSQGPCVERVHQCEMFAILQW